MKIISNLKDTWYLWKIRRGWILYKDIPFWYYFKVYRDLLNKCTLPTDIEVYRDTYYNTILKSLSKETSTLDKWELGLSVKAVFNALLTGRITGALYAIEAIKSYPGKTVPNDKFVYKHSEEKGLTYISLKDNPDEVLTVITVPPRQLSLSTTDTVMLFLKEYGY